MRMIECRWQAGFQFCIFGKAINTNQMKSLLSCILSLFAVLSLNSSIFGQNDKEISIAIINIIRCDTLPETTACRSTLTLPDKREIALTANNQVKYPVYTEGANALKITNSCSAPKSNSTATESMQITVNTKHGGEYYLLFNGSTLREVTKENMIRYLKKCNK